ncbi:MAG: hypothetical protein E7580_07445 [Ruminococcaceae bacterium]|nr:hypothetical protein [Oscillospiraceae bacterium]
MQKYLLPEKGTFYKANLHTHSTFSDGHLTPEEIKDYYRSHGYSILSCTDHDVFITHNELTDEDFLVLNGYELDVSQPESEASPVTGGRKTCHMGFIATTPEMETPVCWHREKYIPVKAQPHKDKVKFDPAVPDYVRTYSAEGVSDMMRLGRENGFFVIYNHPTWSCEDYSDYMGYEHLHAMEIMNYTCIRAGFPEYNERVYDDLLRGGKRILCIGADDGHGTGSMCGCYMMVKAEKLEYRAVMDAIMKGDFYSSEGPEIKALYLEDGKVTVETSEVAEIRFTTGIRKAKRFVPGEDQPLACATYELPVDKDPYYFRITVTDKNGKHAYTNAYFLDELNK